MRYLLKCWILPILYYWSFPNSWSLNQKVGAYNFNIGVKENPEIWPQAVKKSDIKLGPYL